MSNKLTRIFTEPLIQFLIIGACIYGVYGMFGAPEEDFRDTTVHVDANRINAFISEWESRWNRPPTQQEVDGLIQSYINEDVLYRQAVAMGLNEDDPITRRRMAQKLEFLTSDLAMMAQPAEGELEAYFAENQALYQQADRVTFSQVFFDPDARDEATLGDADEVLTQLRAAGVPNAGSTKAGDQFMLQSDFQSASEADIARQMGSGFAESVMKLDAGQWHGPVLSGYGVHLIYIYDYQSSPPAVYEDVQATVLEDWQLAKRETFNAEFLKELRGRYKIVIDEIPTGRVLEQAKETAATNETAEAPAS